MDPARIILLCLSLSIFIIALRRLRSYRLKERHMILFTLTGVPFLFLSIWPTTVGWISQRLHIQYQTVSLLGVTGFVILMLFELLSIVSLQERRIATLAQIVGILMEKQGLNDRPTPAAPPAPPEQPTNK